MTVESEEFREDGVSIDLQWSKHDHIDNLQITYNVSITPVVQPNILVFDSMTGASLTVAYNTLYNVSVIFVATVGDSVCDSVRVSFIPLHYSELDICTLLLFIFIKNLAEF